MSDEVVNSTAAILRREPEMASASRSTRRISPVTVDSVTPNAPDSGPTMIPNEAADNEEGLLKMHPIEQINI